LGLLLKNHLLILPLLLKAARAITRKFPYKWVFQKSLETFEDISGTRKAVNMGTNGFRKLICKSTNNLLNICAHKG
jgi:hypothetical protein